MNSLAIASARPFALTAMLLVFVGCASPDEIGSAAGSGTYYSNGPDDMWCHGGTYPPDVVVTPPPARPIDAPHPAHPIALPPATPAPAPTPMPSIPSMPRPSFSR